MIEFVVGLDQNNLLILQYLAFLDVSLWVLNDIEWPLDPPANTIRV